MIALSQSVGAQSPPESAGESAAESGLTATFVGFSPSDVDQAEKELDTAVKDLGAYLATGGKNGREWGKFLILERLRKRLRERGTVDVAPLAAAGERFESGEPGLELPVFSKVRRAIRRLRVVSWQIANPKAHEEFKEHVAALEGALGAWRGSGAEEDLERLTAEMNWLEQRGQATPLIEQLRDEFSRPNFQLDVTQEFLSFVGSRHVDESAPVTDVILGTRISGVGRTVGELSLELAPASDRAIIDTILHATNYATTVGRNGPARIYSSAETQIATRKRFVIDSQGLHSLPAMSVARAHSRIRGVGSTKRGCLDRIVKKVARKKIPKQKNQSERIAARHAEQRSNDRLDSESGELLTRFNAGFRKRFRDPLVRRDEFPRVLRFSSSEREFRLVALHDGPGRLAAQSAPPELTGEPILAIRLHESFVNNLAAGLLAGRTLDKARVEQMAVRLLGQVPQELQGDEDRGPWSITFASPQPVTLKIADQGLALTIRGQRFTSDDRRFDAMNVTARYRLESTPDGVRLVRQGELEILPPGFVQGRSIPLRLQTLRNLLKHRFERIFVPEVVSQGLVLPGRLRQSRPLQPTQMHADAGWLAVGWRQPTSSDLAAAPATRPVFLRTGD